MIYGSLLVAGGLCELASAVLCEGIHVVGCKLFALLQSIAWWAWNCCTVFICHACLKQNLFM